MSRESAHLVVGRSLAVALLIAGLGTWASTLFPLRLGNVDWEVGTLGELAAVGGLGVMGAVAVLAVSLYERRRWAVGLSALLLLTLGLVGLMALALLATDAPLVLDAAKFAPNETVAQGMKKVLIKGLALLLLFSIALLVAGISAVRSFHRSR